MPQIAQQDNICIKIDNFSLAEINDNAKRQIANAIDRGCGLDIVLVYEDDEYNFQHRVLTVGYSTDDKTYSVSIIEDNGIEYLNFSKPDPEPTEDEQV